MTQRGLQVADEDLERSRADFAETGCAVLPRFLGPALVDPILANINESCLYAKHEVCDEGIFGTTLFAPPDDPARVAVNFVLNNVDLFRVVESITGCPHLENFLGRLHRTEADAGQQIDWHNDVADFRVMGININLTVGTYSGGLFQLRGPDLRLKAEVGRLEAGDAFIFNIAAGWAHRLTAVESGSRTVAVGWFRTAPERSLFAQACFRYVPSGDRSEVNRSNRRG
jgi:hypothetical protein